MPKPKPPTPIGQIKTGVVPGGFSANRYRRREISYTVIKEKAKHVLDWKYVRTARLGT